MYLLFKVCVLDSEITSYIHIQTTCPVLQDCQVQCLTDRVCRLVVFESESQRKDAIIAELRKELAVYKKNPMAKDLRYVNYVESRAEIL